MGIMEWLRRGTKAPDSTSYAALDERAMKTLGVIEARIKAGDDRTALSLVKSALSAPNIRTAAPTIGVPDIGFKGVRQQLFQRFNLIDLYGIAHNLSTIKTAIVSLRQEVFRRGIDWEPAFAFRCSGCEVDYAEKDLGFRSIHENTPSRPRASRPRARTPGVWPVSRRTRCCWSWASPPPAPTPFRPPAGPPSASPSPGGA